MEIRAEWRTTGDTENAIGDMENAIVFIDDDSNIVRRAIAGDQKALGAFLNDLLSMESGWEEIQVSDSQRDPASWGHLVMARANTGEVLEMDPVIFWHNIAIQFRMKGTDAWVRSKASGAA